MATLWTRLRTLAFCQSDRKRAALRISVARRLFMLRPNINIAEALHRGLHEIVGPGLPPGSASSVFTDGFATKVGELVVLVCVSRDSIHRWELVRVPPRPIAHVVRAQKLGYSLDVLAVPDNNRRVRRTGFALPRVLVSAFEHPGSRLC